MPPDELRDLIQSYVKDGIILREQIAEICFALNGGADYNTIWGMSFEDREIIVKVINRRRKEQNPNSKEYM